LKVDGHRFQAKIGKGNRLSDNDIVQIPLTDQGRGLVRIDREFPELNLLELSVIMVSIPMPSPSTCAIEITQQSKGSYQGVKLSLG
jgi:hypothetical protein